MQLFAIRFLENATFPNPFLENATFSNPVLENATFPNPFLEYATFPNPFLENANFPNLQAAHVKEALIWPQYQSVFRKCDFSQKRTAPLPNTDFFLQNYGNFFRKAIMITFVYFLLTPTFSNCFIQHYNKNKLK